MGQRGERVGEEPHLEWLASVTATGLNRANAGEGAHRLTEQAALGVDASRRRPRGRPHLTLLSGSTGGSAYWAPHKANTMTPAHTKATTMTETSRRGPPPAPRPRAR